jgi:hypothetical protein
MTIKSLKDAGFDVKKKTGRNFFITRGKIKATIEKVTDTKFRYEQNESTANLDILLEQISNSFNS